MKACCQVVRVLKAIGFSNHAFCELFNLKKKKKKIRNVSREATSATRCIYKFFSVPIPIISIPLLSLEKMYFLSKSKRRKSCFKRFEEEKVYLALEEEKKETVKRLPVVSRSRIDRATSRAS